MVQHAKVRSGCKARDERNTSPMRRAATAVQTVDDKNAMRKTGGDATLDKRQPKPQT